MRRIVPIALAAAAPAVLAIAFLAGSTPDEEEIRWSVLTSALHVRALAEGRFATWTSTLGFGVPQPLIPNLNMHPLVPLLAVVSPAAWVRALYVAHSALGAFGMWHLGRLLQLSPFVRAACVLSFLFATPTQNYSFTDTWPSHYVLWTSAPWLLLMAWRLLAATGRDLRRWSVLLGVCAGLALASTNPGHAPVYSVVVAAVVAAEWRAVLARWSWLAVAILIALAIAGPNLVQVATERTLAADLEVVKESNPLPPAAAWDAFLRPFSSSEHPWQVDVVLRGARRPFFGGPFAVLALLGAFLFWRSHRGLVLGAAFAFLMLFTPLLPLISVHRYHFRDPLVLCAVPLAGLAADHLLRLQRTRRLAVLLLVAQVALVTAGVSPFLDRMWSPDARQAMWFRGATADTPFVDSLLGLMSSPGRLAYSPEVDAEVSARERLPEGLGVNALAFRGVSLVNGSFKGISTDVLWPDDQLFYGRIRIPHQLVESDEGLDLLGIRYVLANPDETVAPGLGARGSVPKRYGGTLVLYENPDAGPGGFVIGGATQGLPELPLYAGCANDRLLCRDLTGLAHLRQGDVAISREGGRIAVADVDSRNEPRLLVLIEMFRPEWVARGDERPLVTRSVGPGLLGVILPPGTTSVQLDYRPTALIVANVVRWIALAGGLMALLLLSRSRAPLRVE